MQEIYSFLNQYSFFQKREGYIIHEIQSYGRRSKFRVSYCNENYLVLITTKRVSKYVKRLNLLSSEYRKLIQFRYLSEDENVLVLDYYGSLDGLDLSKISNIITREEEANILNQLFALIQKLHSYQTEYIDFDGKGNSWYEYIKNLLTESLDKSMVYGIIDERKKNFVLKALFCNKDYFDSVSTCFIHADLTIVNVCYSKNLDQVYFIDFDDFMIGDPFYDYSRLILTKFKERYCPNIDENIIHILYTLRVTLNWYCFICDRNLDYELPTREIELLINKIEHFLSNKFTIA